MYTKTMMIQAVKDAMKGVQTAYTDYTDKSWKTKMESLTPGQAIPRKGVFYDQANKDAYNARVLELSQKAKSAVNTYITENRRKATVEPTDAELRAVQMFLLMDPEALAPAEYKRRISDMMETYKGNPITYETLRSHAVKHGLHDFQPHPAIRAQEAEDSIMNTVTSFFAGRRLYSKNELVTTDGEVAFLAENIANEACIIEEA